MLHVWTLKRYVKWKKPVTQDHACIMWFHLYKMSAGGKSLKTEILVVGEG